MMTDTPARKAPTRRRFLLLTATAAGSLGAASLLPTRGHATTEAMDGAIREAVGNGKLQTGKVKIDLPPIVENGNAVPLTVSVESPMTESDHVKKIHVFNEKNPQPQVAVFHFGPRSGRAAAATRIRLADTQKVTAIAEMSDGSFWEASMDVVVTLAACIES
jgi:sulfur-oxidizing protein SoxY